MPAASLFTWFAAPVSGARNLVLRSSAVPEAKLLFLLGGGLLLLAALVRRHYPFGNATVPKDLQVVLWMSPKGTTEPTPTNEHK